LDSVLTERELAEWMVYYSLEPWGSKAQDFRAAHIMAVITNALWVVRATIVKLATRKRLAKEAHKIQDFLPKFDEVKKKMSWQQMLSVVKALNTKMGGKDLTNGH
jgi:hypothetical protein